MIKNSSKKIYSDNEKENLLNFLTDLKLPIIEMNKYIRSEKNIDIIGQMNPIQLEKLYLSIINRMEIDSNFFLWLSKKIK